MGTFRSHITELLNLGSVNSGGEAESMVKAAIQNADRRMLGASRQLQRQREFTLTTVAATSQYGLPYGVKAVVNIDDAANRRRIRAMTAEAYDRSYPGRVESSDPTEYYDLGNYGVQKQPAATVALTVESSVAADSANRFVTLNFFDANGVKTREILTLTGTTPVSTTALADPAQGGIERVVKSVDDGYSITGNITVKDSSGNVLARIPPMVTSPTYRWIEFNWIPSVARTYTVRALQEVPPLTNDDDWPQFDENYHQLLTYIAGIEVLPAFGKQSLADRFQAVAFGPSGKTGLMAEFLSNGDPEPDLVFTFSNIQNEPKAHLPHRQPVIGIDYGLVS